MKIYEWQSGNFIEQNSLWESLRLSHISHGIISIVGAGGKTSLMYDLAEELSKRGKRIVVTTSTHIAYPEDYQTVILEQASDMKSVVWGSGILVAGGGLVDGETRKLCGLEPSEIHKLTEFCDVLLIEADGAKRLPFKIPADHEPVIIPQTEVVIGCVGLDCVGQQWKEACFRWELATERSGISSDEYITPEQVATVLKAEWGTKKAVENRTYRLVLNKADDEDCLEKAKRIVESLGMMKENIYCVAVSRETW